MSRIRNTDKNKHTFASLSAKNCKNLLLFINFISLKIKKWLTWPLPGEGRKPRTCPVHHLIRWWTSGSGICSSASPDHALAQTTMIFCIFWCLSSPLMCRNNWGYIFHALAQTTSSIYGRLNMELDLQSLFGLHVYSCTIGYSDYDVFLENDEGSRVYRCKKLF
jgi:hypothetical protein